MLGLWWPRASVLRRQRLLPGRRDLFEQQVHPMRRAQPTRLPRQSLRVGRLPQRGSSLRRGRHGVWSCRGHLHRGWRLRGRCDDVRWSWPGVLHGARRRTAAFLLGDGLGLRGRGRRAALPPLRRSRAALLQRQFLRHRHVQRRGRQPRVPLTSTKRGRSPARTQRAGTVPPASAAIASAGSARLYNTTSSIRPCSGWEMLSTFLLVPR
jgi:hypothetical protein